MKRNDNLTRRQFLRHGVSAAAAGPFVLRILPALAQAKGRPRAGKMRYRRLGRTELMISEVGYGGHYKNKDRTERIACIDTALDLGINFFDCFQAAPRYPEIEQIGDALDFLGRRDEAIIGAHLWTFGRFYKMDDIDRVLRLLKTDVIDIGWLTALHLKLTDEPVETAIKAKEAGKLRFIGVTGHEKTQVIESLRHGDVFDVMLFPYSYGFEKGKEYHFPMAKKRDMGIITIKPFGGGSFFRAKAKIEKLLAEKKYKGVTPAQACLRYILSNKDICCTIPGMTTVTQVVENAAASGGGALAAVEREFLEKAAALWHESALAKYPFLEEWRA